MFPTYGKWVGFSLAAFVGLALLATEACTSSSGSGGAGGGTGGGGAAATLNGCDEATTTVSPGDVGISFPMTAAPAQYSPACVKIHKGAKVTWNGAFSSHPLTPEGTGNPIFATSAGTTASFTFANEGAFGYHCSFHPTSMLGAVFVVP